MQLIRKEIMWRGTQEAEGTGFEYQQAGNSRAGVQIPLSPPSDPLKSTVSRGFYVVRYRDRVVRWVRTELS